MSKSLFFITILGLLLAGCASTEPTDTRAPTLAPTATATSEPTTNTFVKRRWQLKKIKVAWISFESKIQVAEDEFGEILANNGNCRLPCLLGFEVSNQSFEDLNEFFADLAVQEPVLSENEEIFHDFGYEEHLGDGSFTSVYSIGDLNILTGYEYVKSGESVDKIVLHATHFFDYRSEDEIITEAGFGEEAFVNYLQYFRLDDIIGNYGSPEIVSVLFIPKTEMDSGPYNRFSLLLSYENQGFVIEYDYLSKENGSSYHVCLSQYAGLVVSVFDKGLSLQEIGTELNFGHSQFWNEFRPINEVTSWGINKFIDTVTTSFQGACLESPMELWKYR